MSDIGSKLKVLIEVAFGGDRYVLLWPKHLNILELKQAKFLTVFEFLGQGPVTRAWIARALKEYNDRDDVWRPEFLAAALFWHTSAQKLEIEKEAIELLQEQGAAAIATHQTSKEGCAILAGPYHYSAGILRPVWRLYADTQGAFLHSLIHDRSGAPSQLHLASLAPSTMAIAVPTRIQESHITALTEEGPLQGWRIAVKDNFEIKNIGRSACNRAYHELYPPANKTAPCIQKLCDAGAVVVGTTKLASFAATEEPLECIDWPAPCNPRADGYQSPAGSSSGSGVAAAAYEWLDITIGSDTSGSGRRPAHWNGCFGMRPSHGYLSSEGLLDSFPRFDVPTFFGRELEKCRAFAEIWHGQDLPKQLSIQKRPLSIVYALDYMDKINNPHQMSLIDSFTADLEKTFDIRHQNISFEKAWQANPPQHANGASLPEYMKDVSRDSFFYEDYHNFNPFRKGYKEKYGKDAYISPPVRWQWELASHITSAAHSEALARLEVYKEWFNNVIMKPGEQITLVLIPIEEMAPRYRDEMSTSHFNPVGVPNLFVSPILKAPELTVPIGEVTYHSRVTGNEEKLPVAVSVIGPPGQDVLLFDLVLKSLRKNGRPGRVLAGRKMFREDG